MPVSERPDSELLPVVSRLWATLVEGMRLRVELFALELGEERRRLGELLLATFAMVGALFMLLWSLQAALLVILWDTHRVAIAIGSCACWAALALGCGLFHRLRRRREPPFAATTSVLARDEEMVRRLL